MKRVYFLIYMLLAMVFIVACKKNPVDTPVGDDNVVDYGDVKAMFEARQLTGELVDTVDMGEYLTISDISLGRPDSRVWEIKSNDRTVTVNTSDSKVQSLFFPVGNKDYDVKLKVERSSDKQTDELLKQNFIHVRQIDVVADFVTDAPADDLPKSEGGGDYKIGRGLPLTFLNKSKGVPDNLSWEFEKGTPLTSDMDNLQVVFKKDGLLTVKLVATRSSDGSTSETTKLIRVIQKYLSLQKISVDNRTITMTYDQDVMEDPSVAKDDFNIEVLTAAGNIIDAGIESITSSGSTLTITLDQDTYQDDVVMISYDSENGKLAAKDPAYIGRDMVRTHAVEIDNMFFKGEFDGGFETWIDKATNIQPQGGRSAFNLEVSNVKPLSGDKSGYFEIGVNGDKYADIMQKVSNYHSITPGDEYQVGVWLYVEEMTDPSININVYWRLGAMSGGWWLGDNNYSVGQVTNADIGKWVYVTSKVGTGLLNGSSGNFMWRIGNHCKFYMDNMKMYPASSFRARPSN